MGTVLFSFNIVLFVVPHFSLYYLSNDQQMEEPFKTLIVLSHYLEVTLLFVVKEVLLPLSRW